MWVQWLLQDVDQYHTGFAEWKGQLFSRLGVDKALGVLAKWVVCCFMKTSGLEIVTPKNLGTQVSPKPPNGWFLIGRLFTCNLCELFFLVELFGPEKKKNKLKKAPI